MNTDATRDLLDVVHAACDDLSSPEAVARTPAGDWNAELWKTLQDIGITLLPVAENFGGAGGDLPTAAAVLRAIGSHAAAVPAAETALLAGWLLSICGTDIPSGPLTAALAPPDMVLSRTGRGWELDGVLRRVPWARHCSVVAVVVQHEMVDHLVLVDPAATVVETGVNLAGEPRDTLHLTSVPISPDRARRLPEHGEVEAGFRRRAALGRALLMSGAADRAVDLSTRYAGQREQFGRPLAKFQAIQQHIAHMAGEALALHVATDAATVALAEGSNPGMAIAAAKTTAGHAASTIAALAHQVHGAIGFTSEHDLHLTTTRLWAWRDEDGNEHEWASQLGEQALRTPPDQLWAQLLRP